MKKNNIIEIPRTAFNELKVRLHDSSTFTVEKNKITIGTKYGDLTHTETSMELR